MSTRENIQVDWLTILIFGILVIFGWFNIYAANYDPGSANPIFSTTSEPGKQLIFIAGTAIIIGVIMVMDFKFYDSISYILYGVFILLLAVVLVLGQKIGGARSWFVIGAFKFQPSEFAKFATALALARYIDSTPGFRFDRLSNLVASAGMILVPMGLILLQPDAGTVLVFGSFILALYREGLSPLVLWLGIAAILLFVLTLIVTKASLFIGLTVLLAIALFFIIRKQGFNRIALFAIGITLVVGGYIMSVDYMFNSVLRPHQQKRILLTLNLIQDPSGDGYNLYQSKQTIGSGGLWGKGFLQGDRTQLGYVPEQSTDFIFTTLAEEHGWVGTFLVIVLFGTFLWRLIYLAERQKSRFARIYGYSVFGVFFLHFMINVGMTIGLFPVVGIPLPFFSYGGSSLWSFTILLFILIKLDAHRGQVLMR